MLPRSTKSLDRQPAAGLRGLIFDLGGVLYDATLWRRSLWRLLAQFGIRGDYDSFYQTWDRDYLVDVHCGRREYGEALQAFLLATGLSWGLVDEVQVASRIQQQSLEAGVRPLPGVAATTSQLAGMGLALGVLSDSEFPAAQLEEKIDRLGLGGRFQVILSSFDLKASKPDPVCYRAALDALGIAADQAAFVGHCAQHLAGASASGLRTIAINYDHDAIADEYLRRFAELPGIVEQWALAPAPC